MSSLYHDRDGSICVMSYNIQSIPSIIVPSTNLSTRKEVLPAFIRKIVHKYSVKILILQELFDKDVFKAVKEALADLLPNTTGIMGVKHDFLKWTSFLDNSEMPFHFTNGGVCIFTEYKIIEKHQLVFKNCRNTCALGRKGACLAVLESNGKRVNVVGTHLQAYDGPSMEVRKLQYLEILSWLNRLFANKIESDHHYTACKDHPIVMGGDFNTCCFNHKADFDIMFAQSRMSDFVRFEHTVSLDHKEATYCTVANDYCKISNSEDFSHVYDYVFVGPGVRVLQPQTVVRDKLERPVSVRSFYLHCFGTSKKRVYNASDHFPVYVVVYF